MNLFRLRHNAFGRVVLDAEAREGAARGRLRKRSSTRCGARRSMTITTDPTARPDTTAMVIVHNMFRRHFRALPALVRSVADGDVARAARIVTFIDELTAGLHHHHSGEDELMWPLLLDRAPTDNELINRMEEQHERIGELYERAQHQAREFAANADPAVRGSLAATLDALAAALDEHMAEEEQHILPVVERVMTVAEWERLGERGREGIPKDRRLVFLGEIYGTDPDWRGSTH